MNSRRLIDYLARSEEMRARYHFSMLRAYSREKVLHRADGGSGKSVADLFVRSQSRVDVPAGSDAIET